MIHEFFVVWFYSGVIKTEAEETEGDEGYGKEAKVLPKEEVEGGSEEEFDEERMEEDNDEEQEMEGDEEGDSLNNPEDLSLVDYSRYEDPNLPDPATEPSHVTEAGPPRVQSQGKLSCDICGLSCISINVLLVHKRSHTGKHRKLSPVAIRVTDMSTVTVQ